MEKITAPFTADQVDALNRFQRLGYVLPFTCPGHEGGGRDLVATRAGWICCHCDYRQDWAHAVMLKLPPDHIASLIADGHGSEVVESIAQWMHDETDDPDSCPDHTWPEHENDDGQRGGGFVKIVPKFIVEKFRDRARRLTARYGDLGISATAAPPAWQPMETAPRDGTWRESVEILADIKLRVTAVRIQHRVDAAGERNSTSITIGLSLATEVLRAMNDAADFLDTHVLKRPKQ